MDGSSHINDRWQKAKERIELRRFILMFLYLRVLFLLFVLQEDIVLRQRGISFAAQVKGESLAANVPQIGGGGLVGLASVAVIFFVPLIPFFAFKHVGRELGESRLRAMLFGTEVSVSGAGQRLPGVVHPTGET